MQGSFDPILSSGAGASRIKVANSKDCPSPAEPNIGAKLKLCTEGDKCPSIMLDVTYKHGRLDRGGSDPPSNVLLQWFTEVVTGA